MLARLFVRLLRLIAGEKLFNATLKPCQPHVSNDLTALMSAYQYATTRNLKPQILSIYAYRYSAETLIKMHEACGKLTK